MASVRTFVAITLGDSLIKSIGDAINGFSSAKAKVKWVEPQNTHVTLKFLGNVEEERLPEVFTACEKAAVGIAPIEIEVRAVGCFPNMKRPRVVWVGIEKGAEAIKQLQKKVESELALIGFPKEDRPFKAHMTIGRVKGQQGIAGLCRILDDDKDLHIGSMVADKISVIKSKTLPTGPIYTEMKAISLR